jgi:hypothetical protein
MPKTTDTLHSDQISAAQASIAKSVVGCDPRAEERCSVYRSELVRDGRDAARFSDHHFRISSIHGDSRYHGVLTIHNVSASAWLAHPVFAAKEADTDPLTDFPSRRSAAAYRVNATNHFMPGNAREFQTRVDTGDRGGIGVTDSTCFYSNPNLTHPRLRNWPFDYSRSTPGAETSTALYVAFICLSFVLHSG